MNISQPVAAAILAWLHLSTAGLAFGLLLAEHWLCRRPLDRPQLRLLVAADLSYFLALIGVLTTGLAWLLAADPEPGLHVSNRLFLLKITIFVGIGLAAFTANRQFLRWNRESRSAPVFAPLTREVDRIRALIALELALWLLAPLPAVMVASGFGSR